jgi:CBS domain containing-hemolysin-like protein
MGIVIILILFILILCLSLAAKTYLSVPIYELKRRSRSDTKLSKTLYQVASYQKSYWLLNDLLVLILTTSLYVVTVNSFGWIWASLFTLIFTYVIFFWLPKRSPGKLSTNLAILLARPLKFILRHIDPLFLKVFKTSSEHNNQPHTGIYEASDIYRLIDQQKNQDDSRLENYQLEIIKNVLDFSKLKVQDVMTPKRKVKSLSADDNLGPVVLTELHDSGHHYFPIYQNKDANIVGTLSVEMIGDNSSSKISQIMDPKIMYANEEQEISEVLHAMLASGRHLFVVLNDSGNYSGIITSKEILKSLVGELVIDDLELYENKELVTAKFKTDKKA